MLLCRPAHIAGAWHVLESRRVRSVRLDVRYHRDAFARQLPRPGRRADSRAPRRGRRGDILIGLADADTLDGGAHSDILLGGHGSDSLMGGAGRDALWG